MPAFVVYGRRAIPSELPTFNPPRRTRHVQVRRARAGAVATCVSGGGGTAAQRATVTQRPDDALHASARSSGTVRVIVRLQGVRVHDTRFLTIASIPAF